MTDEARGGLRILRPGSSLLSFVAAAVVVVFLFGDAVLRGAWPIVARWMPLALLILWGLWVLLVRSSIRYDRRELVVINGLRVHTLPWARVAEVLRGVQLKVELDDGRTITCFGSPFPSRPGRDGRHSVADAVVELTDAKDSARSSSDPATVEWDVPSAAVGIILLVAAVLAVTVVRG